MANKQDNPDKTTKGGERDRARASKRKAGRPKGSTKAKMELRRKDSSGQLVKRDKAATDQERTLKRHRADCNRLAKLIQDGTLADQDAQSTGALARSTKILHELERSAYGLDEQGAKLKAIILIPAGPAEMEVWQGIAKQAGLGDGPAEAPSGPVRRIEADIMGPAPEPEEEED